MTRSAHLSEVKLQWIIRGQGNIQAPHKKLPHRIPVVFQKERIVAQRTTRENQSTTMTDQTKNKSHHKKTLH